jgi:hypothetical protein
VTLVAGMLVAPFTKAVEMTPADQVEASTPRLSVTVTAPRAPDAVAAPAVTVARVEVPGALMAMEPAPMVKVAVVTCACAGPAKPATTRPVAMTKVLIFELVLIGVPAFMEILGPRRCDLLCMSAANLKNSSW